MAKNPKDQKPRATYLEDVKPVPFVPTHYPGRKAEVVKVKKPVEPDDGRRTRFRSGVSTHADAELDRMLSKPEPRRRRPKQVDVGAAQGNRQMATLVASQTPKAAPKASKAAPKAVQFKDLYADSGVPEKAGKPISKGAAAKTPTAVPVATAPNNRRKP